MLWLTSKVILRAENLVSSLRLNAQNVTYSLSGRLLLVSEQDLVDDARI